MRFIDFGIYDDGDIYEDDTDVPAGYIAKQEAHAHYIACRLRYVATIIPGAGEAFRIIRLALHTALDRQGSFTHEAFVDRTEATDHIGLIVHHTGSEFSVAHMQLILKGKRAKARE